MTLSNAVRQRIINLAKDQKITIHALALNSGIAYSTISSFMNGKCKSINIKTLLHICEGFGITLREFFHDPLFKEFDPNAKSKK